MDRFHGSDPVATGPNFVGAGELLGTIGKDRLVRTGRVIEGDRCLNARAMR
jgi:hypothetical protein